MFEALYFFDNINLTISVVKNNHKRQLRFLQTNKRSFSFTQNIYSNIKEKGGQAASICVQFSGNVK